jgi:hypothetical protein
MNIFTATLDFLKGKKTYIVGIVAIAYGILFKDSNAIFIGLTACGLRAGVSTEIANIAVGK